MSLINESCLLHMRGGVFGRGLNMAKCTHACKSLTLGHQVTCIYVRYLSVYVCMFTYREREREVVKILFETQSLCVSVLLD